MNIKIISASNVILIKGISLKDSTAKGATRHVCNALDNLKRIALFAHKDSTFINNQKKKYA